MVVLCFLADLLATAAAASPNNAGGSCVEGRVMEECHGNASIQDEQLQTGMQIVWVFFFQFTSCNNENVLLLCFFYIVGKKKIPLKVVCFLRCN